MGAQIGEAIRPDNIAGAVRFEVLLIAGKSRTEEEEWPLAQAWLEIASKAYRALQAGKFGAEGRTVNAEMGEKMGIFVTRIFQRATSGSAVRLIR
jgi:hypothetical protein